MLDTIHPLAIFTGFISTSDDQVRTCLFSYVTLWQHIHPVTDGHTLQEMGLPPGPQYTKILEALRAAWIDGEVHSAEEEQKLLEKFLAETH
jgi:tRNA nucleotidyltransferase (CCA-adding enzyme)